MAGANPAGVMIDSRGSCEKEEGHYIETEVCIK